MSSNEVQVRKGYVSIDGIEYVPMLTLEDLRAKLGAARQRERKLREALQQCEGLLAEVTRLELSTAPGDVVDPEGGYAGQNKNMLVDGRVWKAEKGERFPLWYLVHDVLEATAGQEKDGEDSDL